jgi:hypothetical protein
VRNRLVRALVAARSRADGGFVAVETADCVFLRQRKMPRREKVFDKNRRSAESRERPQVPHGAIKNAAYGRPGLDRFQLSADRDRLLEVLSSNWHRLGWRLSRARTLQRLRKALRPLRGISSIDSWTRHFLTERTLEAKPKEARATKAKLADEVKSFYPISQSYEFAAQQYDRIEAAANSDSVVAANEIWQEYKRRGDELEECERRFLATKARIDDLEETLASQTAYICQTQLLKFMARGYARNPIVLASALAGLPEIGCRHSFVLCSRKRSTLRPSMRYQIFRTIEDIWKQRDRGSTRSLTDQFRLAILGQPLAVREKDARGHGPASAGLKGRENYVRKFLCENWRYLKKALERLHPSRHLLGEAPYVITSRFYANIGMPRMPEEQLLAEIEALKD